MPICYSRCIECGEWCLPVVGMNEQSDIDVVCLHCMHQAIDEQMLKFIQDPEHTNLPVDQLFV